MPGRKPVSGDDELVIYRLVGYKYKLESECLDSVLMSRVTYNKKVVDRYIKFIDLPSHIVN